MAVRRAFYYVVANGFLLFFLAHASGRLAASAASIALLNLYWLVARRAARGRPALPEEELVHVLTAIALSLERKRTLPEALSAGALAAGPILAEPMDGIVREILLGASFESALKTARAPDAEPAFSAAMWAVAFGVETGAPLPQILDRISAGLAHQLELKRQFQVLSLNGRLSALMLSALPVVLLAALMPFRPDLLAFVASSPPGAALLATLLVCWAVGLRIILRVSGGWRGRDEGRLDALEEELPILVDLAAEGLDIGLEPRNLLERLSRGVKSKELGELIAGVLGSAELGLPLAEALRGAAGPGVSRSFVRFARLLADCGPGPGSAHVLRFQARELRLERHHRQALEAQKAPFLLLAALVFLVFPLTFGLLLVPFVARVSATLGR